MLSDIAVKDAAGFLQLVDQAKAAKPPVKAKSKA
jgi:ribosomal protein L20